jgi:hypothetical protein
MPPGVPPSINFGVEAGQAVAEAVGSGRSPLEADIPSEVGGPVDVIWDTTYEQPDYADDPIDLPGPSTGDVVNPQNPDGQGVRNTVGAVLAGGVIIAVIVALGQLFTFNFNIGDSTE